MDLSAINDRNKVIALIFLPVLSESHIQDIILEIELTKWSVLDIVPKNQSVARIASVVSGTDKADNISSKKHFSYFDSTLKVYKNKKIRMIHFQTKLMHLFIVIISLIHAIVKVDV